MHDFVDMDFSEFADESMELLECNRIVKQIIVDEECGKRMKDTKIKEDKNFNISENAATKIELILCQKPT